MSANPTTDNHVPDLRELNRLLVDRFRVKRRSVACNKRQSHSLPAGMINALAAAPLDEVPDGVHVDLLIGVVDPQRAMQIAGAASVREGTFPVGELGASACSSIFAAPYRTGYSVFAIGDGGGRMHNRLDASEMFVAIPRHHFRYVVELIENFSIDPHKMRSVIMPSFAAKAQAQAEGEA